MHVRDEILQTISSDREIYTAFLSRLIQTPSPNPPGDTRKAVAQIQAFLTNNFSFPPDNIHIVCAPDQQDKPSIVAEFNGNAGPGERVILNGHLDTYPSKEEQADSVRDPYSGHIADGKIHGRGAVDMKAGTAALVITFGLLYRQRQHLRGSVGLMCVSDEETGGRYGTRYLLDGARFGNKWHADVVLNAEPTGLQSVRSGEKGTLRLTFTVRTQRQNGAYTFLSRGANVVAVRLIVELLEIEKMKPRVEPELERYLGSEEVRAVADQIMGTGAGRNLLATTVNIGKILGGLKVNMVPEECVFEADVRLPPGLDESTVLSHIDRILQRYPEVIVQKQEAASNPSNYCTTDHPMARRLEESVESVTGRKPVLITGLGATDCKFFRYKGIPAYVVGPSPESMCSSEEAVKVDEFLSVIKVHALAAGEHLKFVQT